MKGNLPPGPLPRPRKQARRGGALLTDSLAVCFLPPTLLARIIDSPIVVLKTPIVVINCTDPSQLGGAGLVSSNHSGRGVTWFVQIALCQWLALQSNHSPVTRAPVTVRSPTGRSATALRYEPIALQHTILELQSSVNTQDSGPLPTGPHIPLSIT